jgi:hypothetical protein
VLALIAISLVAPTALAAPANDNFGAAALFVALPFNDHTSNAGATTEFGEPAPCGAIGSTIWYRFTPNVFNTHTVVVDTFGSLMPDTVVAIYLQNPATGSLINLACNDDAVGLWSRATFEAVTGLNYYIQVGGFGGAQGDINLHVWPGPVI